jgi:hypothetical protein
MTWRAYLLQYRHTEQLSAHKICHRGRCQGSVTCALQTFIGLDATADLGICGASPERTEFHGTRLERRQAVRTKYFRLVGTAGRRDTFRDASTAFLIPPESA